MFDYAENIARIAADRAINATTESTARKVASGHTVRAIEGLARNRATMSSQPADWDTQPFLLGTPDGVIDLETGKRLDPKREHRITKSTAVVPADTSAGAEQWLMALHLIYRDDAEMVEYVQKKAGYALTADVREDSVDVPFGPGGNGKTLVFGTLTGIMGDYAHVMAAEALMETYGERHPEELARLVGVRLAIASEISEGKTGTSRA